MAVYTCPTTRASGVARGGERGEGLAPFLIVWAHFRYEASNTATFHCQYSMKVNSLQAPESHCRIGKGQF